MTREYIIFQNEMIPLAYDIISDVGISVEYIFLNEQKSTKQFYLLPHSV